MSKISKTTAKKRAITRNVNATVQTNASAVGTRLEALLFPNGVPRPLTLKDVFIAFAALLGRDYEQLAEFDRNLATEKGQDAQRRRGRTRDVTRVRGQLMSLRSTVESFYGAEAVAELGLAGETPRAADALATSAANALEGFDEVLSEHETLFDLDAPDLAPVVASLTAAVDDLNDSLELLDLDVRETEETRAQYGEADETWQHHYSPVAAILEAFYRLAEMPAHAERVRPTSRRRAGEPEPIDEQTDAEQPQEDLVEDEE